MDIDQGESTVDPILIGRTWHFEDGSTLPLVSGGDGPEGEGEGDAGEGGDSGQAGEEDNFLPDGSLGGDFLQRVPEEHREILKPYVGQWDAGVTRRFQSIHSEYEPYKQFKENGISADVLQQGVTLVDLLNNNPNYLFQLLKQELGDEQGSGEPPQSGQNEELQGLPPELLDRFNNNENALKGLVDYLVNQEQAQKEAAEDQALADLLTSLHTEYGNFDDGFVVGRIAQGMTPDDAIKEWNSVLQAALSDQDKSGNGPGASAPPVLRGGGRSLPLGGTDVKKASNKDVTDLVTNVLQQANASGR